jgi:hypothetical protein
MRKVLIGVAIVISLGLLSVGGCAIGLVSFFVKDAVKVAKQEFSPTRLLQKYEWFKNQAAALDSMKAKISIFDANVKSFNEDYGTNRAKWPRDVRQDYALSRQEVAGLKAIFNNLAAEYNAKMVEFNYAFCNTGQMPRGLPADLKPLPREFATYITR